MFILVDESIPSSVIEVDSPCKIIWVHLHVQKTMDMTLGSFYTPPHSPETIWNDLSQCLSQLRHKFANAVLLLGGDFNCPEIDWSTGLLVDSYISRTFRESLISFSYDFIIYARTSQYYTNKRLKYP